MALHLMKIHRLSNPLTSVIAAALWLVGVSSYAPRAWADPGFDQQVIPLSTVPDSYTMLRGSFVASPDSSRIAYRVSNTGVGNFKTVMVDNLLMQGRSGIVYGPVFSPNSKAVVALFLQGRQAMLEIKSSESTVRPIAVQDPVTAPIFSPDSQRTAYIGRDEKFRFVVLDAKPQVVMYDEVRAESMAFSPDSKHFVFEARRGDRWFVVVNGQEGNSYLEVAHATFSLDSRRLAYWAKTPAGWVMVKDGQEDTLVTAQQQAGLFFSPDSSKLAAIAHRAGRWHVVLDSRFAPGYDAIDPESLAFSPDSGRLVYAAHDNGRWQVVLDGIAMGGFDSLLPGSMRFSPDSSRLAFAVKSEAGWSVVVDDQIHRPFLQIAAQSMQFSLNSNRFAYVAAVGDGKAAIIVDGRRWAVCHGVEELAFTPDSSRVVWVERFAGTSRVVVDGTASAFAFDQIVPGASLVFDGPDRFHTLVLKRPGPVFFRVETSLRPWINTGDERAQPLRVDSGPIPAHSPVSDR